MLLCPSCEDSRFPSVPKPPNEAVITTPIRSAVDTRSVDGGHKQTVNERCTSEVSAEVMDRSSSSSHQCTTCCKDIPHDGRMITCVICDGDYHVECTGLPEKVVQSLLIIVSHTGWTCSSCRAAARQAMQKFQASLTALSETVAQLKVEMHKLSHNTTVKSMQTDYEQSKSTTTTSVLEKDVNKLKKELGTLQSSLKPAQLTGDISQMKSELQAVKLEIATVKEYAQPVKWPSDDTAKTMRTMVHSELADKERRRKNIVVHGLPPVNGIDDVDVFTDLCATHFTIKPVVVRERCHRLRSRAGTIPPLLIVLDREHSAQELLKQSGSLRKSNSAVYLNPDLTPAERQLAFEQRQIRRQRKQQEQRQKQGENESPRDQQGTPQLSANAMPFVPPCI